MLLLVASPFAYVYMCVHVCTCVHMCAWVCRHAGVYMYVCACMRMRKHTINNFRCKFAQEGADLRV